MREIKAERWRERASEQEREREVIPGALLVNNGRVIRQDLHWSRWLRDSLISLTGEWRHQRVRWREIEGDLTYIRHV